MDVIINLHFLKVRRGSYFKHLSMFNKIQKKIYKKKNYIIIDKPPDQ